MNGHKKTKQQHFLMVAFPGQGQLNPSLHLARRISAAGATITFCAPISAHRRMFPEIDGDSNVERGGITFIPFTDGDDSFTKRGKFTDAEFRCRFDNLGRRGVAAIIADLAANGRPANCIIYSLLMNWVVDIALENQIPVVFYWNQPATVFLIYYHYFSGYKRQIVEHLDDPEFKVRFPALPPFSTNELPSFLRVTSAADVYFPILKHLEEMFDIFDKKFSKLTVFFNTFDALEAGVLSSAPQEKFDMIAVGPSLPSAYDSDEASIGGDLFERDRKDYLSWLDAKLPASVVYVAFGSLKLVNKRQIEEMFKALRAFDKSYLLVLRKDNRDEIGIGDHEDGEDEKGMVVEWCDQSRVLLHPAVGCFISHCGWNSTLETIAAGVPVVCVPGWSDQKTNAWLVENAFGIGVRCVVDVEGIATAEEIARCLGLVMGDSERAMDMRKKARAWSKAAREAVGEGGSSDLNLKAFINSEGHSSNY